MIGSYNSAKQAAKDTNYFDVSLEMVEIWEGDEKCDLALCRTGNHI